MNTSNQTNKAAFDLWWEWATDAVMMLTPEQRENPAIVNETVRTQMSPLREAGSADRYDFGLVAFAP